MSASLMSLKPEKFPEDQHLSSPIPRIVVVGGGAGGLELVTRLGNTLGAKHQAEIFLIDASLTHIWKPLLHEVAAGSLNAFEQEVDYFSHASRHHFQFIPGRLAGLNRKSRTILLAPMQTPALPAREIPYDVVVLAIGSQSNDFGIPGVRDHCLFLDSREQADAIRQRLLAECLKRQARDWYHLPETRLTTELPEPDGVNAVATQLETVPTVGNHTPHTEFSLCIVGGGATGVELAAELSESIRQLQRHGFAEIQPHQVSITLIEASDRLLPPLPEAVSRRARADLEAMGVQVLTQSTVREVSEESLTLSDGRILPATMCIWAAGIKASPVLSLLDGLETNRLNQLVVGATLQTSHDPNIFAMGDCASLIPDGDTRALPPRAQVANQQGIYLSKALRDYIQNKPLNAFHFLDRGSLVSLSHHSTVGNLIGNIQVYGLAARLMYISLYRLHQAALHGLPHMVLLLVRDMLSGRTRPILKLH